MYVCFVRGQRSPESYFYSMARVFYYLVNKNPLEGDALPTLDGSGESVIADEFSENYLDSLLELLDLDNSQYELEFPSIGGVT